MPPSRLILGLLLVPAHSFAGVARMPTLDAAPGMAAPAYSPALPLPAFATPARLAPTFAAPSLAPLLSPLPQPAAAAAPALQAVRAAAAALPEKTAPATEAKSAVGRPFDDSVEHKPVSESVAGSFSLPSALPAAARDAASRPQAAPAAPKTAAFSSAADRRNYRLARMIMRPLVRLLYKAKISGLENIPAGPVLIVPNHIAYMDAILISFAADRQMRFMMKREIYDRAPRLFAALGAIPVSGKEGPKAIEAALDAAREAIRAGQSVVIFPEGQLTLTGGMSSFKRGFEHIVAEAPAPVIPAYIDGMWGSLFSMQKGPSAWSRIKELPRPISVRFGPALAGKPTAQTARLAVSELGADAMNERVRSRRRPLVREFLAAAAKSWKKPALADSLDADLTYGKALTGAILLGRALDPELPAQEEISRRLGFETPGYKNIAVLMPTSAGGALANLALSSIGRVPVNINYTSTPEALEHSLKSADIQAIVTSRRFLEALKDKLGFELPPGRKIVYLEDMAPKIPKWKKTAMYVLLKMLPSLWAEKIFLRKAATNLDDTATIMFTSGSSGLPKGVVLTHANVLSNIEMVREVLPWAKRDAVLGVLPFFHSFGYTVTFWLPLVSGMSAAYHSNPLQAGAIAKLAAKTRATILLGTPDYIQHYARKVPAEAFASLRLVISGAEKLRDSVAQAFEDKFGIRPLEGYGATELSPVASVGVPNKGKQKGSKPGSPGRALPGGVIKAVDLVTGALKPFGEIGMLLFKGPNVMKEYLGEPIKTAKVLKDGWYVTGDLGSVDRDGLVDITGRQSRMSKIGDMVSHVAVEEKLQQASGLTDTAFVVTGVIDAKRGESLVALYKDWDGDIDELLAKMRKSGVPNNWLPARSAFYKVDKIPLLGTGKLDLKAVNELAEKLTGS